MSTTKRTIGTGPTTDLVFKILNALALGFLAWLANEQLTDRDFRAQGPRYTQVEAFTMRDELREADRDIKGEIARIRAKQDLLPRQIDLHRDAIRELRRRVDEYCPPGRHSNDALGDGIILGGEP